MARRRISANTVANPQGETACIVVRTNNNGDQYGVFWDGGSLSDGEDIAWYPSLQAAMTRAAAEALSYALGA